MSAGGVEVTLPGVKSVGVPRSLRVWMCRRAGSERIGSYSPGEDAKSGRDTGRRETP